MAHEFHELARTGNRRPSSDYYTEGLAEHLAQHALDGGKLQIGRVAVISRENIAIESLKRFRTIRQRSLRNIVSDAGYADSPDPERINYCKAHAFVTFLVTEAHNIFDDLAARLDHGDDAGSAWDLATQHAPDLDVRYEEWLQRLATSQPFEAEPVAGRSWTPTGSKESRSWSEDASRMPNFYVLRHQPGSS